MFRHAPMKRAREMQDWARPFASGTSSAGVMTLIRTICSERRPHLSQFHCTDRINKDGQRTTAVYAQAFARYRRALSTTMPSMTRPFSPSTLINPRSSGKRR